MNRDQFKELARGNLEAWRQNSYPGRFVIVGLNPAGDQLIQITGVTGRSETSRNRVYVHEGDGLVRTAPADPGKSVGDPAKTIYPAMIENGEVFVIGNGLQTESALMAAAHPDKGMEQLLGNWTYEDDSICTPRITALCRVNNGVYTVSMSILRKSPFGTSCDHAVYHYGELLPGTGFCLRTYLQDGDPPPHYDGEPFLLPFYGDEAMIADTLHYALDVNNRVCLALKAIDLKTGQSRKPFIHNKYERKG